MGHKNKKKAITTTDAEPSSLSNWINPFGTSLESQAEFARIQSLKEKGDFAAATNGRVENAEVLPVFYRIAADHVLKFGSKEEGIFRISPGASTVTNMRSAIETGKKTSFDEKDDPYAVACLLKIFFRELPNPLLTFEYYACFIAIQAFPEQFRIEALAKLLRILPPIHRLVLFNLCEVMSIISKDSASNKMTLENLAIVMGPNILRSSDDSIEIVVGDAVRSNGVVRLLFLEHKNLRALVENQTKKESEDNNNPNAGSNNSIEDPEKVDPPEDFCGRMSRVYESHHQESVQELRNQENLLLTDENKEAFEKQLAERYAKLKIGLLDEPSNLSNDETTWNATEFNSVYTNTLRMKRFSRSNNQSYPPEQASPSTSETSKSAPVVSSEYLTRPEVILQRESQEPKKSNEYAQPSNVEEAMSRVSSDSTQPFPRSQIQSQHPLPLSSAPIASQKAPSIVRQQPKQYQHQQQKPPLPLQRPSSLPEQPQQQQQQQQMRQQNQSPFLLAPTKGTISTTVPRKTVGKQATEITKTIARNNMNAVTGADLSKLYLSGMKK